MPEARIRAGARRAAVVSIALLAAGSLVEGLASWTLFVRETLRSPRVAERAHTRHDAELGWVSVPSIRLPDLYGPGIGLSTDRLGARGGRDVAPSAGPGRRRVACSGDSFTLGYGVADDEAWCAQLGRLDPTVEPVNLGQGGYGLDQSFLWWRRVAPAVGADVHLFTVNHYLLDRLAHSEMGGYGKPTLALGAGNLEVRNVPLRPPFLHPWLPAARRAARGLRLFQMSRTAAPPPGGGGAPSARPLEWAPVVERVFAELQALDRSGGTETRLVYLPRAADAVHEASLPWRVACARAAARLGIPYLDLVPAFRELPRSALATYFLGESPLGYAGAAGHYSPIGNAWVAERIAATLP